MTDFPPPAGIWFDGSTNRRHAVSLRLDRSLEMREAGQIVAAWPFADIRRIAAPAGLVRLRCVSAPALARLELRDPAVWQAVLARCPTPDNEGATGAISDRRIVAWSIAAVAAIAGTIWFGIPAAADYLAGMVPFAWEKPLGQAVENQFRVVFDGQACTRPDGRAALLKLTARLGEAAALPVALDPVVIQSTIPNAFALPGGRVLITSVLIGQTRTPDELAGVLAHELGHVRHRDGLRRLIRDGGTGFLIGLLFGDVSGGGAVLFTARSLLGAAYARDLETGADGVAIEVMHRLGRPTAPMGALLARIDTSGTEFALVRDHPVTPERTARFQREDHAADGPPLLTGAEWEALRRICGGRG